MAALTLVVGTKSLSSWSLRAWLAVKATGEPFQEIVIQLDRPETREAILKHSPSGRIPALKADGLVVWDSLAIGEYLAETFPNAQLWPADAAARAFARSVAAEMHSGFGEMRRQMSMDLKRDHPGKGHTPDALADARRVIEIWTACRQRFGQGGPFLFGHFSLADCMYAPVATRLRTYAVPVTGEAAAYRDTMLALPALQEWVAAAKAEG